MPGKPRVRPGRPSRRSVRGSTVVVAERSGPHRRSRRRLGTLGAVVALAPLLAGCDGPVELDHTTSGAPPPALPARAAPLHPTRLLWSAPAHDWYLESVQVSDGYLVLTAGRRIVVRDVVTGQERWHVEMTSGGSLSEVTVAGGYLLATYQLGFNGRKGPELRVFELATGRMVWRRPVAFVDATRDVVLGSGWGDAGGIYRLADGTEVPGWPPAFPCPSTSSWLFAKDSVVDVCDASKQATRVDTTGKVRWRAKLRLPRQAELRPPEYANDRLLVVETAEEGEERLTAVDLRTGRTLGTGGKFRYARVQLTPTGWCQWGAHELLRVVNLLACSDARTGRFIWSVVTDTEPDRWHQNEREFRVGERALAVAVRPEAASPGRSELRLLRLSDGTPLFRMPLDPALGGRVSVAGYGQGILVLVGNGRVAVYADPHAGSAGQRHTL